MATEITTGERSRPPTLSQYLIRRLSELGIRKVFGIPGDYVLGFYDELQKSEIDVVGTTREDCAGYAADAYARVTGLGALCVTYCVGGLSVVNSVAGAFAEKSPLLVISGAPGMAERRRNALLHHKVRDFDTQRQVFEKITVATAALEDPETAFREIERVIAAVLRFKRPGYIEIPRDRAHLAPSFYHPFTSVEPTSDPAELDEAVRETADRLTKAERPALLLGVEIHRFGLQDLAIKFAEKHQIPMCSTLLGKSVVPESHPLYAGVYEGALGHESTRRFVEESDCLLMLGTFLTDINMGIYTAELDPARCVLVTSEDLRISHHHYHEVLLSDFVRELGAKSLTVAKRPLPEDRPKPPGKFTPQKGAKLTVRRLFENVNRVLTEDMVVVCDVGDALFAGADLFIHKRTEFVSPAYYTSMGFSVPAALGVQSADINARPIVLVGDGAFQMTGMELSTICRRKLCPIVIVLNNKGYTTERFIQDGPYNDIGEWSYHRLPEILGGGRGFEARTETEFDSALTAALAYKDNFSLVNAHLDPYDRSDALERLASRLAKQVSDAKPAG